MKIVYSDRNSYAQLSGINKAARDNPGAFVARCERDFEYQLDALINDFKSGAVNKILMLAGPSSSGKTTTAFKLSERFGALGHNAPVVSLDEFFLGRECYPKLPDGSPDMESVYALDIALIRSCLRDLLHKGEAVFPRFDFTTSSRLEQGNSIALGEGDLLIIEGIHALNPILIDSLETSALYRAYISTRTRILDQEEPIYAPKDARLIRRMIRDHKFRGYHAINTLKKWNNVLEGEAKYIYPYRDMVDFKIDSSFEYEAGVFRSYLLEIIGGGERCGSDEAELGRLLGCLDDFVDIPQALVPENSLLREFIGLPDVGDMASASKSSTI